MIFSILTVVPALLGLVAAQSSSLMSTVSASESLVPSTASGVLNSSSTTSESLASSTASGPLNSSSETSASGASQTGTVTTHVIDVGGTNGSLVFLPNNIQAQVGDMIQFHFFSKNHSVVQSTFDQPCIPLQNSDPSRTDAFYSGFMPTNATAGSTSNILTYTIRVNNDKPIWFYCSQGKHCQAGMVGAINAPASGNNTVDAFKALAANAAENVSPSPGPGTENGIQPGTGTIVPTAGSSTTASERSSSATATFTGVIAPLNNGASGFSAQLLLSLGAVAVTAWILM